jgi:hypothetical protein
VNVASPSIDDVFCIYLWRSLQAPGTLYLARGIYNASAVCAELIAAGYIVRVVQMVTNVEYQLRDEALVPCTDRAGKAPRRKLMPRSAPSQATA